MNKRHYEHTLPNIRGSLSNTYDTSMSGFISRIIDEHLKKHEKEMSALYTECINKPL